MKGFCGHIPKAAPSEAVLAFSSPLRLQSGPTAICLSACARLQAINREWRAGLRGRVLHSGADSQTGLLAVRVEEAGQKEWMLNVSLRERGRCAKLPLSSKETVRIRTVSFRLGKKENSVVRECKTLQESSGCRSPFLCFFPSLSLSLPHFAKGTQCTHMVLSKWTLTKYFIA